MRQQIWIPHVLPCLNDIINAKRTVFRAGKGNARGDAYSAIKKKWGFAIGMIARSNSFQPVSSGRFVYEFIERNRKRDPSNVIAGGVKLIEDALQDAELLENDGWKNILEIRTKWSVSTTPGVLVTVEECVPWKKHSSTTS